MNNGRSFAEYSLSLSSRDVCFIICLFHCLSLNTGLISLKLLDIIVSLLRGCLGHIIQYISKKVFFFNLVIAVCYGITLIRMRWQNILLQLNLNYLTKTVEHDSVLRGFQWGSLLGTEKTKFNLLVVKEFTVKLFLICYATYWKCQNRRLL